MPVQPLEDEVIDQLRSTVILPDAVAVVKELVENGLDAGAKSVEVAVSPDMLTRICVTDDGGGIPARDRDLLGRFGCTSKVASWRDLDTAVRTSLGFRGVALASIALCGKVRITTRTKEEAVASEFTLAGTRPPLQRDAGETGTKPKERPVSAPIGTSITVSRLFDQHPVRKAQALKMQKKIQSSIVSLLKMYAVVRSSVQFSFRVTGNTSQDWRYTPEKDGQLRAAVIQSYGLSVASGCIYAKTSYGDGVTSTGKFALEMFFSRPERHSEHDKQTWHNVKSGPHSKKNPQKLAIVSIDGRPMNASQGTGKKLAQRFRSKFQDTFQDQTPLHFLFLSLVCPKSTYDANVDGLKQDVIFAKESKVLQICEKMFMEIFSSNALLPIRAKTVPLKRVNETLATKMSIGEGRGGATDNAESREDTNMDNCDSVMNEEKDKTSQPVIDEETQQPKVTEIDIDNVIGLWNVNMTPEPTPIQQLVQSLTVLATRQQVENFLTPHPRTNTKPTIRPSSSVNPWSIASQVARANISTRNQEKLPSSPVRTPPKKSCDSSQKVNALGLGILTPPSSASRKEMNHEKGKTDITGPVTLHGTNFGWADSPDITPEKITQLLSHESVGNARHDSSKRIPIPLYTGSSSFHENQEQSLPFRQKPKSADFVGARMPGREQEGSKDEQDGATLVSSTHEAEEESEDKEEDAEEEVVRFLPRGNLGESEGLAFVRSRRLVSPMFMDDTSKEGRVSAPQSQEPSQEPPLSSITTYIGEHKFGSKMSMIQRLRHDDRRHGPLQQTRSSHYLSQPRPKSTFGQVATPYSITRYLASTNIDKDNIDHNTPSTDHTLRPGGARLRCDRSVSSQSVSRDRQQASHTLTVTQKGLAMGLKDKGLPFSPDQMNGLTSGIKASNGLTKRGWKVSGDHSESNGSDGIHSPTTAERGGRVTITEYTRTWNVTRQKVAKAARVFRPWEGYLTTFEKSRLKEPLGVHRVEKHIRQRERDIKAKCRPYALAIGR